MRLRERQPVERRTPLPPVDSHLDTAAKTALPSPPPRMLPRRKATAAPALNLSPRRILNYHLPRSLGNGVRKNGVRTPRIFKDEVLFRRQPPEAKITRRSKNNPENGQIALVLQCIF